MNDNQKLLLLTLRELRDNVRLLQQLRSRCRGWDLESVLALHQKKLLSLEWEGRSLAVQRGLELSEPVISFPLLLLPRRCSDVRIARCWIDRSRESRSRCSSALRRYPYTDPASIFCQKALDFCAHVPDQMEPFLRQ